MGDWWSRLWGTADQQPPPAPDRGGAGGHNDGNAPEAVESAVTHVQHHVPETGEGLTTEVGNQPPAATGITESGVVTKFQYLQEDYSEPQISASGNTEADRIAAEAKEVFDSQALNFRMAVDSSLRDFKESVGENTHSDLPACFSSWKKTAFEVHELASYKENEVFVVSRRVVNGCDDPIVTAIFPNKHKNALTPEALAVDGNVLKLLNACRDLLANKESAKQQIEEKISELSSITPHTRKTSSILEELKSLPGEIDRFASDVITLLKNIDEALPYGQKPAHDTGKTVERPSRRVQLTVVSVIPEES